MFKVGDAVVVSHGPRHLGYHRMMVVTKVHKKYLELDDGSKWNVDNGLPWGMKPNYRWGERKRLEHWSQEHETANLRHDVSYSFNKQKDELTLKQLQEIWLIIGPPSEV